MNNDHKDAVHKYLKYYSNVYDFEDAQMAEITNKYIKIKYDEKISIINFKKEISEEEIHETLVSMIKDI